MSRVKKLPRVEFHSHDWVPAFAAFLPNAGTKNPESTAFCVLNLSAFLENVETGDMDPADVPYLVAESMMHEIIHVLEQWAGVEFSEERVEALLDKYRTAYQGMSQQELDAKTLAYAPLGTEE